MRRVLIYEWRLWQDRFAQKMAGASHADHCFNPTWLCVSQILLGSSLCTGDGGANPLREDQAPPKDQVTRDRRRTGQCAVSTRMKGCPIPPCLVTGNGLREPCAALTETLAAEFARQAFGRRDGPATGLRTNIRHAHRIFANMPMQAIPLARGAGRGRRMFERPAGPDPRVVWATRQGQRPRWSSAIHLAARSLRLRMGLGFRIRRSAFAAAHYAQHRKTEIRMTTGKTCAASLALVLALAFSPPSGPRAAPLSGPSAQPLATGVTTTVAEKEKVGMHHEKRHRRRHVMHGKHHGGCGGANMYYSRKKHHCMDARNK
jgi:hypothetical protein